MDLFTSLASSLLEKKGLETEGGPLRYDSLGSDSIPDKRRYERTVHRSEATITRGRWPRRQKVQVEITDITPIGIGLGSAVPYSPSQEKETVAVQWLVPPQLNPYGRIKKYILEGTLVHSQGVRFERLVQEQIQDRDARGHKFIVAFLASGLAAVICLLKARNVVSFWYQPIFQIYSLTAATYILSRVGLSAFYREPRDNGLSPMITVIVAAKNEELHIEKTIRHCFESRYPAGRVEVLIIDDGSTDNTWEVLLGLKARFPDMRCFRFETNKGKRHAMALGAEKAKGEILVFLDSDSLLEPEALYRIVQPFKDPRVGAVAGHTLVVIEADNFISKMEAVRYFVSQRIMKAAESVFNAVTCCPGPLSAYRREAMLRVLPQWLAQSFLGVPATFGDDRSLTNYLLPFYRVVYHAGARCRTFVPNKWAVFFRQQLRWKKSWVRETTIAVRFMYRKNPIAAISYYLGVIVTLFSPIIALRAMLYLPIITGSMTFLPYLLGLLLVYSFFGLMYQYHTQSRRWYYGLAFALLYVFILSFQNYYAMLTVRKNHWGTR